jgi:hypothetical protein
MKKTFYVDIEFGYDEIEVEADTEEEAIKEAKEVVRRGWITPSWDHFSVTEQE